MHTAEAQYRCWLLESGEHQQRDKHKMVSVPAATAGEGVMGVGCICNKLVVVKMYFGPTLVCILTQSMTLWLYRRKEELCPLSKL